MSIHHILTRAAIVARSERLLAKINEYFKDASAQGFSLEEVDADGALRKIQKGLISTLKNERRIAALKSQP